MMIMLLSCNVYTYDAPLMRARQSSLLHLYRARQTGAPVCFACSGGALLELVFAPRFPSLHAMIPASRLTYSLTNEFYLGPHE